MKSLMRWIFLSLLGVGSMQISAQPAPDFARLILDANAVESLERLEWQATGQNFEAGQNVVAGESLIASD